MRQFGLIGQSLSHSFSAKYFNDKFEKEGIPDARFDLFELKSIEELKSVLQKNPDLEGFSVTIPYKETIIPFLDDMGPIVKEIGACNCVKVKDGKLIGYNTDVEGFSQSILPLIERHQYSAIVLGNGGASKAVVYALEHMSIDVQVIARNPKNESERSWDKLDAALMEQYKIIVNTTPLGMYPEINAAPDIPYPAMDRFYLAYDLIYNPEKTSFLQKSEDQCAEISNGLEMLQLQADAAWAIWNEE